MNTAPPISSRRTAQLTNAPASRQGERGEATRARCFTWLKGQIAFPDPGSLVCWFSLSLFLAGWSWAITSVFPPLPALFLFLVWPAATSKIGRAVCATLGTGCGFALPFLAGNLAVAFGLLVVKVLLPGSTLLLVWGVLGFCWLAAWILPDRRPEKGAVRTCWGEVFAVLLCLAASTLWNQHQCPPTVAMGDQVVFRPWADHFTHATYVALLLEPHSILEIGHYELRGQPALLYHYASYLFPVAFASASGCTAFESLCAFWTPLGLVFMGLSGYVLGGVLWGARAGLASLVAVLLLPDPSVLPTANPMLGYYHVLVAGPALVYGIAVAATALTLVIDAARRGDRVGVFGALLLSATSVVFKTHIFVAAFPLTLLFAFSCRGILPRARVFLGVSVAVVGLLVMILANRWQIGPPLRPGLSGGDFYFRVLAQQVQDTTLGEKYSVFLPAGGFRSHIGTAACLLSLATFGFLVILCPLVSVLAAWRRRLELADLLPVGALCIYLAMALGLPMNLGHGTPEELQHRPFVWAYFLVAGLTAARLTALLGDQIPRKAVWLVCLVLLAWPAWQGRTVQHQNTQWGPQFVDVKLSRGLVSCAEYIRRHPPVDACIQDSHPNEVSHILGGVLGGLSQRRSFLARPEGWKAVSPGFRAKGYSEMTDQLKQLEQASTLAELRSSAEITGIRWYVLRPGGRVAWPATFFEHPAFEADGFRVYDLADGLKPYSEAGHCDGEREK
jgi:hypothetical protein